VDNSSPPLVRPGHPIQKKPENSTFFGIFAIISYFAQFSPPYPDVENIHRFTFIYPHAYPQKNMSVTPEK